MQIKRLGRKPLFMSGSSATIGPSMSDPVISALPRATPCGRRARQCRPRRQTTGESRRATATKTIDARYVGRVAERTPFNDRARWSLRSFEGRWIESLDLLLWPATTSTGYTWPPCLSVHTGPAPCFDMLGILFDKKEGPDLNTHVFFFFDRLSAV